MPAPAKFTRRRERRLLALVEAGATVAEACRAVEISRKTLYRRARTDAFFAVELRAARARLPASVAGVEPLDWQLLARQLEREHPERWALPPGGGDPFDFDPEA